MDRAVYGSSADKLRFDEFVESKRVFLTSTQKVRSGLAGLFWFSDDYNSIDDVRGVQEFTNGDILFKKEISPRGSHSDHRELDLMRPKGRVTLMPDGVVINVGLKCPDSAIRLVKKQFELGRVEGIVRVVRGGHWDSKKVEEQ